SFIVTGRDGGVSIWQSDAGQRVWSVDGGIASPKDGWLAGSGDKIIVDNGDGAVAILRCEGCGPGERAVRAARDRVVRTLRATELEMYLGKRERAASPPRRTFSDKIGRVEVIRRSQQEIATIVEYSYSGARGRNGVGLAVSAVAAGG